MLMLVALFILGCMLVPFLLICLLIKALIR